jgi:transcriptional regulator with XRE-family HTH domain
MLTIGEILKKEREGKNLTLEEIEKLTKIRKKNLEAIEKNDWRKFPSKTYIVGIIKSYGKFLQLNEDKLIAFFRRQYEKKEEIKFKETVRKTYLTPQTKKIFKILIYLIVMIFSLYFGYQLKIYFSPPRVEIVSPKENIFKKLDRIKLIGKTEKEAIININGERIYQNKDNIFKTSIPLINPKNEVIIEVTGANGRTTIIKKVFEKR